MLPSYQKNSFALALLSIATLTLAEQQEIEETVPSFEEQLKQIYMPSETLEMTIDNYRKYNTKLDFEAGFQRTQPVIGIATTDLFSDLMKTASFDYEHFTWETNVNFVHYAGSWAVPVRYDLSDEDLEQLLDSVNGVFFAGGASILVDHETGEQSEFYQTAKRIWEYMKRQKDDKGIDFPIFGICQGFELIHFLANDDAKDTLSNVTIYGESRPLDFTVADVKSSGQYTLFEPFPDSLLEQIETEGLLYHAHDWVIKTETYTEREQLRDFFDILATDEHQGEEFVVAVEAKDYPVTGLMFHPETQQRHTVNTIRMSDGALNGKVNNETTDAINFYFSEHVRQQAAKTMDSHRFVDPEFGERMEWLNSNFGLTKSGVWSNLPSFGF